MITIRLQSASHYPVNKKEIKAAVEQLLISRSMKNSEVSIMIVGDRLMKKLNSTYRKIDATTDVLSFPQQDPTQAMNPFVGPPDDVLYLGDIIVSYPQAIEEATHDQMRIDEKIVQLVLHGLDHLMGIHHPE